MGKEVTQHEAKVAAGVILFLAITMTMIGQQSGISQTLTGHNVLMGNTKDVREGWVTQNDIRMGWRAYVDQTILGAPTTEEGTIIFISSTNYYVRLKQAGSVIAVKKESGNSLPLQSQVVVTYVRSQGQLVPLSIKEQ